MSPSHESAEACAEHENYVAAAAANDSHRLKSLKRAQWLRAAILGANDGLISTTSLMLGVGAAKEDKRSMVLSGLAGALAGACSMAVGEFVSVATQRDIEKEVARSSHKPYQEADHAPETAVEGGTKLQTSPATNSHAGKSSPIVIVVKEDAEMKSILLQEDEGQDVFAHPYMAAGASGLSFICGSFVPILTAILVSQNVPRILAIAAVTSFTLAFLGGFGAYLGGSGIRVSAARVLFGGWVAMAITYGLLKPFDNDDKEGGVDKNY